MSQNLRELLISQTEEYKDNDFVTSLDLQMLACNLLGVDRSKIFSSSLKLDHKKEDKLIDLIKRRSRGEPLAYILGEKGFWNIDLEVNPKVLVPRPETETIIEDVLFSFTKENLNILDLGTGSGAIGLALKKEKPKWEVYCSDISAGALETTKRNSIRNKATVHLVLTNWLEAFRKNFFDLIISNPPYIGQGDKRLDGDGLSHEPKGALVSGPDGKEDLLNISSKSLDFLKQGGYLYLEHSPDQSKQMKKSLENFGYTNIIQLRDLNGDLRVIKGCKE